MNEREVMSGCLMYWSNLALSLTLAVTPRKKEETESTNVECVLIDLGGIGSGGRIISLVS